MSQQRQGGEYGGRGQYQRQKKRAPPPYNGSTDTAGGMFPNMTRCVFTHAYKQAAPSQASSVLSYIYYFHNYLKYQAPCNMICASLVNNDDDDNNSLIFMMPISII
jgi:hypothetical protein